MDKKIVVTVHGIRTRGAWQKALTPHLARHDVIPHHLDYGFFYALFFALPWARESKVDWFKRELDRIVALEKCHRVSIIAHSFGTYLATEVLLRHRQSTLYDRIVLTGSIVRNDFPWDELRESGNLLAVRNERGTRDNVVALGAWLSKWFGWLLGFQLGDSGVYPFDRKGPWIQDAETVAGHSGTHLESMFEKWARYVAFPILCPSVREKITEQLDLLRQHAATELGLERATLRANLFLEHDGQLLISKAHLNMTFAPELMLSFPVGSGCTGLAYREGKPYFLHKSAQGWGKGRIPEAQMGLVHPELSWVLSLPVKALGSDTVLGVVNLDCLCPASEALRNFDDQAWAEFFKGCSWMLDIVSELLLAAPAGL